ncbi:acyl carrier protein [Lichtheimia hyalospora FSU 10163]|nr:acyl carrier protein [Lichtheimia hyalospora FSU 10163]
MFRPTALFNAASRVAAVRAPAMTRFYAAGAGVSVEDRIMDVLKGFDKVDQSKISLDAHFVNDLGLDSLDTVEVVMAIEEEFTVEIPDKEADEIKSARQAVEYINSRKDAH